MACRLHSVSEVCLMKLADILGQLHQFVWFQRAPAKITYLVINIGRIMCLARVQ